MTPNHPTPPHAANDAGGASDRAHSTAGVFARGVLMGIADLIPGVSGGTIAFITGIYARLLTALAYFSQPAFFAHLRQLPRQWRALWHQCDGNFLAVLFAGIVVAILLTSRLLHYLLTEHTANLLSFFFGLVVASVVIIARKLFRQTFYWRHIILFCLALLITLWIVTRPALVADGGTPSLVFVFVGAVVAISAMILPGISGSYLLLILGLYGEIIAALHNGDWLLLAVFACGCGVGILLFSRALSALLARAPTATTYAILGVMVGALPKLFPFKEHAEGMKIILQANVLPAGEPLAWAVGFCLWGMLAMFAIEALATRRL